jgi:hypothetical protein
MRIRWIHGHRIIHRPILRLPQPNPNILNEIINERLFATWVKWGKVFGVDWATIWASTVLLNGWRASIANEAVNAKLTHIDSGANELSYERFLKICTIELTF